MFENFNVIVTRRWRSFEYYNEYFMEIVKKNKSFNLFPIADAILWSQYYLP